LRPFARHGRRNTHMPAGWSRPFSSGVEGIGFLFRFILVIAK
jgi:hypothetical protein